MQTDKIVIPFDAEYEEFRKASDAVIGQIKKVEEQERKYAAFSAEATKQANSYNAVQRQKAAALAEVAKAEEKAAKEAAEAAAKQTVSFTEIQSAIGLAKQAVQGLKEAYDFSREGAEIEFTGERFERLAENIGTTADALMHDLREATKGTLSDLDLMAAATDLVGLGLAKDHDEAVRLATVSAGLGMNMNQLVLTLTNMTTMRFDALGVRVDGFKEKVKALEDQGYSADAAFKEAFLQQAEAQLRVVGNAADSTQGEFLKLEAEIGNFTNAMKIASSEAVAPMLPMLTDFVHKLSVTRDEVSENVKWYENLLPPLRFIHEAIIILKGDQDVYVESTEKVTAAVQEHTKSEEELKEEAKAVEEALKNLTKQNQYELDVIGNLTKETENYTNKQSDLQAKHEELLAKKKELIRQGWSEESDKVREVNQALEENSQAQQDNAAEYEMASQRRILARAEELLSIDGLTNAEKEGLIERGIAMGIYTEEAAAKMRAEEQAAYDLSAALMSIPAEVVTNVYTNYQTATGTPGAYGFSQNTTHAIGGSFEIPQSYGNEGFMMGGGDTASGGEKLTVTPAGQDVIDYKKMARAIRDAMLAVG